MRMWGECVCVGVCVCGSVLVVVWFCECLYGRVFVSLCVNVCICMSGCLCGRVCVCVWVGCLSVNV